MACVSPEARASASLLFITALTVFHAVEVTAFSTAAMASRPQYGARHASGHVRCAGASGLLKLLC
jgi:hypothetical protein